MAKKPAAAAPPTNWRQRERDLLARRRQISADIGELEGARVTLQVALAGADGPRVAEVEAALAQFRAQTTELRAEHEDIEAALVTVGEHRAVELADQRARERERLRVALGLLLDKRTRHASTIDALLAAVEIEMAAMRETAPVISRWAFDLDIGDLPGFSAGAEEASVKAAVMKGSPTLAGVLGIGMPTFEAGQLKGLAVTEAWRGTGVDRRLDDGRQKDAAIRARVEQQAAVTAAARAARVA